MMSASLPRTMIHIPPQFASSTARQVLGKISSLKSFSSSVFNHEKQPKQHSSSLPFHAIPGPGVVENLTRYAKDGFRYHHIEIKELFERFGPIFKYPIPGDTLVYICDPKDIERVFRAEGYPSSRGEILKAAHFFEHEKGVQKGFQGEDKSWYTQRSAVAPKLLRVGAVRPFLPAMINVTNNTVNRFMPGRNTQVLACLKKWAAENVALVLFGQRIGINSNSPSPDAEQLIGVINGHFATEARLAFSVPLYKYLKTPLLKRLYGYLSRLWDINEYLVDEAIQGSCALAKESIVYRIVSEDKLPRNEAVQICTTLFGGGTHTTSASLLRMLHALMNHPNAQHKLHKEINRFLPDNQPPTYQHLAEMRYIKAFMKECTRVYPSPIGNFRVLPKAINIRGYLIPAGTRILLSAIMSRSVEEETYGDSGNFEPERWLRENRMIHPFASLQFGYGPRLCVGKRFAETEMAIFLIRLLQKYKIIPSALPEDQVDWHFNIVQTPSKPYTLVLEERPNP